MKRSPATLKPVRKDRDTGLLKHPKIKPPAAEIRPHTLTAHNDTRTDNYFWLRERGSEAVTACLKAENRYTDAVLRPAAHIKRTIFNEIKARMKKDDSSVPVWKNGCYYYARYETRSQHPIYCRKQGSLKAREKILLDVNKLARGHAYYDIMSLAVSPDGSILAYASDTEGRRVCTVSFKNLKTGKLLPETIEKTTPNFVWAEDGGSLLYTRQDETTLRYNRVFLLSPDRKTHTPVYEEKDPAFSVGVDKSLSRKYLYLSIHSSTSSEYRLIPAGQPRTEPVVFQPRTKKLEYYVSHGGDRFFVLTNHKAKNFRVMQTPETATGLKNWKQLIAHRPDTLIESISAFRDHLVIEETRRGLTRIRIRNRATGRERQLRFNDPAYTAYVGDNPCYETRLLRYGYQSLTTPASVYDFDLKTGGHILKKRQKVLGKFDPGDYRSERIFASAKDGVKIPVSLVYRKGLRRDGANPLYLVGYGAYGISSDPYFSVARLSLLDRGFVFAIAHVRGGSDLGRKWYESGKLLKKKNSFSDFIALAEHLIKRKYTSPAHLYANGGSAGGLLMGAVLNMRPDLFNAVVADVPFVDIVTTMQDTSLPLTAGEYEEWGNPADPKYYRYMKSYSPYDNVTAQDYPHLLITAGLEDSQVQYWEPAKWAAKLRALKTDGNFVLLKTDLNAGHGGRSGRFEAIEDAAFEFSFLLALENRR
ncbi:MAG: S9 family peptidase [Elusimicrobiaceae bacterium]|nr:S9 family peptidase [Elusimicrobiaceae bacterium]